LFNVSIDISQLTDLGLDVDKKFKKVAHEAQMALAEQTHAKIIEWASEKLHSRREIFLENFKIDNPEAEGEEAVITLMGKAVWIDEGLPADFLFKALINGPHSKHGKNGRYNIVPFDTGTGNGPTNTTSYHMDLVNATRDAMRKSKIPWSTIKKDDQGRPVIGKIATIDQSKIKHPTRWFGGVGQGHGPIGAPRQGHTGIPFLQGATVYQRMDKKWDEVKKQEVKTPGRYVLTFRTASEAHPEKWKHPGLPPMNFMKDGFEWAMNTLNKEILPKLVEQYF
jgi:hypothetical protein